MKLSYLLFLSAFTTAVTSASLLSPSAIAKPFVDITSKLCIQFTGWVPVFGPLLCDFDKVTDLFHLPTSHDCNAQRLDGSGGNLTIKLDLGLRKCKDALTICANKPSVLKDVTDLLGCVLIDLPSITSHLGTTVKGTGSGLDGQPDRSILINSILLLVYIVIKKVMQVLCFQSTILISAVLALPAIVAMLFVSAALGIGTGLFPLGLPFTLITLILAVIIVPLIAFVCIIILPLVIVLELVLTPVCLGLAAFLGQIIGEPEPCEIKCPNNNIIETFLGGDPTSALRCVLTPISRLFKLGKTDTKYVEQVLALVEKLLDLVAPVLSGLLEFLGRILENFEFLRLDNVLNLGKK